MHKTRCAAIQDPEERLATWFENAFLLVLRRCRRRRSSRTAVSQFVSSTMRCLCLTSSAGPLGGPSRGRHAVQRVALLTPDRERRADDRESANDEHDAQHVRHCECGLVRRRQEQRANDHVEHAEYH